MHNLQGDIVAILDSTGTAVVQYKYDAWGRQIGCDVEAGNSNATALSTLNPFRYRGYVYDEETGVHYLRSRYYNSSMCRFINADVLLEGNLYTYCEENPVVYIDDSGYAAVCCFDENGGITSWTQYAMTGGVGSSSDGGMTASVYLTLPEEKILPYASLVLRAHIAVASGNLITKASGFLGAAFAREAEIVYNSKSIGNFMKATTAIWGSVIDTAFQNAVGNIFGAEPDSLSKIALGAEVLNVFGSLEDTLEEVTYLRNLGLKVLNINPTYVDLVQKTINYIRNQFLFPIIK